VDDGGRDYIDDGRSSAGESKGKAINHPEALKVQYHYGYCLVIR
jgi:hypothetical protein